MTIILYDIPSRLPGKAWSMNTFRTRICLNYKGLPFKAVWVEYPDVEECCKRIGVGPTEKKPNGADHYTLPAINDNGKIVADSKAIAHYLDEAYPDTPKLYPEGTTVPIDMIDWFLIESYVKPVYTITLPLSYAILNPKSQVYFRKTREEWFGGKKIEEFSPPGPQREEHWKNAKAGLDIVAGMLEKNGNKPYIFGDQFTFADVLLIVYIQWPMTVCSKEEWEAMASWNGGRWGKLMEDSKKLLALSPLE